MSLQPHVVYLIPEETARVARAAFPKGNVYMRMRDTLGMVYDDQTFAALFPPQGQPAESPFRLALTTVFQFAENLSDRQTADAVRGRLDWKYALGLELTDPGFDASVLSEFRARLIAGGAEHLLLDTMLTLFREQGLLKVRGKQRTDSTHVLAAIRRLNRLECIGTTLRHALNTLAVVASEWLRAQVTAEWYERYSPRFEAYRLPKSESEREALAAQVGTDGFQLLRAIYAPTAPAWLREVPAVEILRQVWLQQFYAPTERVQWRAAEDLPPASLLINSPFDPEARYSKKREISWVGYKVHLTESCDADLPHLLTHVATTVAPTHDGTMTATIHADLAAADRLPQEHLVDEGYMDATVLVESQQAYGVDLVGPVARDGSWQAADSGGYDATHFQLDWDRQQAQCPQGKTSREWKATVDTHGNPCLQIAFDRRDCGPCPVRACCTRSKAAGRTLRIRPSQAQFEALQAGRARQQTPEFKVRYRTRAGVEGTIAQGVERSGLRRSRYRGQAKTHLQNVITAAALNLVRVGAWLAEIPHAKTRPSQFARLAPSAP